MIYLPRQFILTNNYNDATDRKRGVLIKANKTSLDDINKERKPLGLYKGNATDLVFLKFHKVSGDTWKAALTHNLPNKSSWPDNSVCEGENEPPQIFQPFEHGTIYRFQKEGRKGLERCFDWSDSVVLSTILRDPLQRVLSWIFSHVGGLDFSTNYGPQLGLEHLQNVSNSLQEGGMFEYTMTLGHPHIPRDAIFKGKPLKPRAPGTAAKDMMTIINQNYDLLSQRIIDTITFDIDIILIKERQCENLIVLSHYLNMSLSGVCPPKIQHWWLKHEEERKNVSEVVLKKLNDMLHTEYIAYNAALKVFNDTVDLIVQASAEKNLTLLLKEVEEQCPLLKCF